VPELTTNVQRQQWRKKENNKDIFRIPIERFKDLKLK
jgi:hypothetical protein